MHNNGLIGRFPEFIDKDGFLDVKKIATSKVHWKKVEKIKAREGNFSGVFYTKKCYDGEHDAEILLSQIFADFIPNTAIYTPAKIGNEIGVISNDISKDSKTMDWFLEKKSKINEKIPYISGSCYSLEQIRFDKLFTEQGLKQYIDMHLLDVACGNIDRHVCNFNVETTNFVLPSFKKVTAVRPFDFGFSINLLTAKEEDVEDYDFKNGLGGYSTLSRGQMIHMFKTNELVQSFYTNAQMSEMIGGIDVHQKVEDIKDAIGYEVSQDFEDKLCNSLNYVAEELIK